LQAAPLGDAAELLERYGAALTDPPTISQKPRKNTAMTGTSNATTTTHHNFTMTHARNSRGRLSGAALSVVRIVVSFLFLCHGALILFGAFGGIDRYGTTAPVGSWPLWWAGVIELVAGGLALLGLFTRPAALLCSGAMAFAYFTMHQPLGLLPLQNYGEPAVLYSWIFLLIAISGPRPVRPGYDAPATTTRIVIRAPGGAPVPSWKSSHQHHQPQQHLFPSQ